MGEHAIENWVFEYDDVENLANWRRAIKLFIAHPRVLEPLAWHPLGLKTRVSIALENENNTLYVDEFKFDLRTRYNEKIAEWQQSPD